MGETVEIATLRGDGTFGAYLAVPEGKPHGAIVVIQEIFGVNHGIRAKVDAWAAAGYVAVAHDLFWRVEPGIELDADTPGDFDKAIAAMTKLDVDAAMTDVEATIRFARDRAGGRKVGVVGYCFGGRIAYLAATRTDSDASVGYYGAGIDGVLNEAHAIANPLLLHFAGEDGFVPKPTLDAIVAATADNAHVTIHIYPGIDHGFATTSGARRVEAAAQEADARTAAFFAAHLAD